MTQQQHGEALRFADTAMGAPVSPALCSAASSLGLLSAPHACLNGDGSQDSSTGYTPSPVGSPTMQTMSWCPNGLECAGVDRVRFTSLDSYATSSVPAPTGDFSVCWLGLVDAPLSAVTLLSGPGYSLSVSAAGVATFTSGGSSVSTSAGAVMGSTEQLVCGTRSGTTGTVSVDGAVTAGTVAAPSGSATVLVGGFSGAARGAVMTSVALSSSDVSRLEAALVPIPHGTRGESLTFTRPSLASCTAPDGSVSWLPPDRPCISGGLRVRPAVTNLLLYSEQFDNVAWGASNTTVTANTATAPDGTLTADTLTSTVAGGYVSQAVTSSGGGYNCYVYADVASGTQGYAVQIYDATTSTALNTASCTASTSWPGYLSACTASVASTTATDSIQCRIYPGGTAGTGTIHAWEAQLATGTVPLPPCRSEGTSATCAGESASLPVSGGAPWATGSVSLDWTPGESTQSVTSALYDSSGGTEGHKLYVDTLGRINFAGYHSSVAGDLLTPCCTITWTAGQTYHLRAVWSGSSATIYRDGASVLTGTLTQVPTSAASSVAVSGDGTESSICVGTTPGACR